MMEGPKNTTRKVVGVNKKRQTKSRNGCQRCKDKRLKCDETKPGCRQCASRKAQCPGYVAQPLIWSTRHERTLLSESNFVNQANHTLEDLISDAQRAIAGSEHPSSPNQSEETIVSESLENDISADIGNDTHHTENEPESSHSIAKNPVRESPGPKDSLDKVRERLQRSTVPEFMVHLPTELVHHYFSQVCSIFSSFDGSLNPFRTTISRLFQSSAPVYYAIQGMAAAYLANHFPRMALVGIQMQQEAYRSLSVQSSSTEELDKILLTMLLIGPTACWHNASDLGLRHLHMAKKLNRKRHQMQGSVTGSQLQRQNEFFDQSLVYWEMLASFVVDGDEIDQGLGLMSSCVFEPANPDPNNNELVFPHPWTGVAADVLRMFGKVGRLIRRFREETARTSHLDFLMVDNFDAMSSPSSTQRMLDIILQAQALEENLLSFGIPPVANVVDAGDGNTPAQHYILLAEAYRCAGLLEIYRVFPSIFHQRLPLADLGMTAGLEGGTSQQFFDTLHTSTHSNPSEWLVSLAIHILSLLQQLPITSGTRCLQPLVFITAAAELRFPTTSISPITAPAFAQPVTTSVFSSISEREVEIAHMREFVMARIQNLKQYLPAKPILNAERLIQETWARSDIGQEVFWMDVMQDLHCESMFG